MKIIRLVLLLPALLSVSVDGLADIPATPVMTLYRFNGNIDVPYYEVNAFLESRKPKPAGTLAQGSAVIPCLVIRNGRPVTNRKGTPYVGFNVVLDVRKATPGSVPRFTEAVAARRALRVRNHHCDSSVRHVIDVRRLVAKKSPPLFDPPIRSVARSALSSAAGVPTADRGDGDLDAIIRAFHNSPHCAAVNSRLTRRRGGLQQAWSRFADEQRQRWPAKSLKQARHLDYTLRTALFEGHLGRGCSAYGACERNTIALSIRNRARGSCAKYQGCAYGGDFEGVASKVSQYNIWDEYLTQISGLTACYLRDDLGSAAGSAQANGAQASDRSAYYDKLETMYAQSLPDVQHILFGDDVDLRTVFPGNSPGDLKQLRHYYHAPAMGKCFPGHKRVEYMSGAVARKGSDFALIANTRIQVDRATEGGYFFRLFDVTLNDNRDDIAIVDSYPGFVVDGRKVLLKPSSRCRPYGIPKGCRLSDVGRHRRTPPWLKAGRPLALTCHIQDRGAQCDSAPSTRVVDLGGRCDREMRPVAGVK